MSSSTMMKGPSIPRASQARTANESRTMAVRVAQAGTAWSRSTTELALAEARRDDGRLVGAGLDSDLGRRHAHVPQHRVRDGAAAGRELERRDIEIRHAVEVMLAPGELERRGPHRL